MASKVTLLFRGEEITSFSFTSEIDPDEIKVRFTNKDIIILGPLFGDESK